MIRHGWMVATMVCLVAGLAIGAPEKSAADGRWQGTLNTANGPVTVTYDFKAKWQVLTGTEESPMFSRSISEGKVNGDKISFKTLSTAILSSTRGPSAAIRFNSKVTDLAANFDVTLKRVSSEKKSAQQ